MPDPFEKSSAAGNGVGDAAGEDPIIVQGEIVDDAAAGAYRGGRSDRDRFTPESPFSQAPSFGPSQADNRAFGIGGVGGTFAAMRSLAGSSADLRRVMTAPLRIVSIGALIPSAIAALFAVSIDGGAKFFGFGIALLGVVAAGLLDLRRRKLATVPAASRAGDPIPRDGLRSLIGLLGLSLLAGMLAAGFDLLALLLVLFGVW